MPQTLNLQTPSFPFARRARVRLTSRRRSGGYAGIVIMAVLGIAAATMMVTPLNASALKNDQERKTGYALALAKQALIGRAASDNNRPGSLPCPDVNNDGLVTMNVDYVGSACVSYVGRLPWKALGLPDLRDADGERLWYALSPEFRELGTVVVNGGTLGTIGVTGNVTAVNAAAVVFAAGATVGNQDRSVANINTPTHYLDGANGATTTAFQAQAPSNVFNDRLLPISPAEVTSVAGVRVTREVSAAFDAYIASGSASLPYAASPSNPGCLAGGSAITCTAVDGLTTGVVPAVPMSTYPVSPAVPTTSQQAYLDGPLGPNGWFHQNDWRQWVAYTVTTACATSTCKSNPSLSFLSSVYKEGDTAALSTAKSTLVVSKVDSTGMNWTTTTYLVH